MGFVIVHWLNKSTKTCSKELKQKITAYASFHQRQMSLRCRAVCCKRSCFRWCCFLIPSGLRTFLCYDVIWSDGRQRNFDFARELGETLFLLTFQLGLLGGSYTWIRKWAPLMCSVWTSDFSGPCELEQIELNQTGEDMDEREGEDCYASSSECLLELL